MTSSVSGARSAALVLLVCLPLAGPGCGAAPDGGRGGLDVVEADIAGIHEAMRAGRLTARELVQAHLDRIAAYDRSGPSLNAITVVHPGALDRAAELDRHFAETGEFAGPLHGIPVIVKDNYQTHDLPVTAGSAALAGYIAAEDAFMVRRLREAGAIVLAKSNMAEWAFSPLETVGSAHPGHTFNPYALNRVPAGSSGGTATAVAASLGVVGLGTDTGNSIRGPSSHAALVGIRPTLGLTSRHGIVPLFLERDVGGPMARSVADAAAVLDVVAGYDRADPATEAARDRIPETYTAFLDAGALDGARLGVVRRLSDRRGADAEVLERFEAALRELEAAGAVLVDPVEMAFMDTVRVRLCSSFRRDVEAWLAAQGADVPVRTLDDVVESGRFDRSVERRLRNALDDGDAGDPARCREAAESVARFQAGLREALARHGLDALIYPTWSNPPRLVGDLASPAGDNSQTPAPPAGFPAVTVPMGWVRGTLPVGLQFLGDAWSEPRLIALAYAYEQRTRHRRPPDAAPPLPLAN